MIDEAEALAQLDGDRDFLQEMVVVMLDVMRSQRVELQAAYEQRDFAMMRACTHAQLPSLKLFGFADAARLFGTFEVVVIAGDPEGSGGLASPVLSHWDAVIDDLGEWLMLQQQR